MESPSEARETPASGKRAETQLGALGTREATREVLSKKTDSHYREASMQNRSGKGDINPDSVGGMKIVGYAVQIVQNETILAENYSSSEFKELVGSQGNKAGKPFHHK